MRGTRAPAEKSYRCWCFTNNILLLRPPGSERDTHISRKIVVPAGRDAAYLRKKAAFGEELGDVRREHHVPEEGQGEGEQSNHSTLRKSNQVRVRKFSFPGNLSSDPYGENTQPDAAPRSNDALLHAVDAHSSRITESWRQKGYPARAHRPQNREQRKPSPPVVV